MRPMYNASFFVPFIFTVKLNSITFVKSADSRGKINVMGNQEGLTGRQFNYEFLMPVAVVIVRQQLDDNTLAGNLQITFMV